MNAVGAYKKASIVNVTLVQEEFRVSKEGPKEEASLDSQIHNPMTVFDKKAQPGFYLAEAEVAVIVGLGSPKTQESYLEAIVACSVTLVLPNEGQSEAVALRQIREEGVDAGYAFCRSRILELTSMAPVGGIMLPAIDAAAVVRQIDASGEAQSKPGSLSERIPQV